MRNARADRGTSRMRTELRRRRAPTREVIELTRPDQELILELVPPPAPRRWRALPGLVVFGAASAAILGTFFFFVDDITSLLTSGSVGGAAAVVGLALIFSVIHGSFANSLLDLLGMRAARKG
jgi:hypothetical protein